MSVAIPNTVAEISAEWLSEATGLNITAVDCQLIGVGVGVTSAVYRTKLTGTDCPKSVIIKLPALDETAKFTATVLRMYIREVRFFNTLVQQTPVLTPKPYFAAVNEETSQFVLVLEDLEGHRVVDQNVGMSIEDTRVAVEALAKIHATWWDKVDPLTAEGTTMAVDNPIYPAVLPGMFDQGLAKVRQELDVPASILEVGDRFAAAIPGLLTALMQGPSTLVHGDYRGDNMMFRPSGEFVLYDFQIIGAGTGAYDLAYFITQSLSHDVASKYEQELFDLWINSLRANGVTDLDRVQLWELYRTAALFCLVYPIIASTGMDLNEPRSRALVNTMNTRFDRALRELDLASLI